MKKVLGAIFLASAVFGITGCSGGNNKNTVHTEKEFYEPQINVPKVYLAMNSTFTKATLEEYLSKFAKVTFDAAHVDETFTVSVDVSKIPLTEGKLAQDGIFDVTYTVKYGNKTKTQKTSVQVVERTVITVKETSAIPAFTPKIEMDDSTTMPGSIIDYLHGIEFHEFDGINETVISKDNIIIDDSTVRLAVPGVHLVKFTIVCQKKYTTHYYREVTINESETPTETEFNKYFIYDNSGLACKLDASITYPKHLMIPSKYKDNNNEEVNITKYKQSAFCDLRGLDDHNDIIKTNFRAIKTIVLDDGHKVAPRTLVALSYWNKPDNSPSIEKLHLPETIELIGDNIISGTDITTLIIPRSVKTMSFAAFDYAWKIKTLVFLGMPVSHQADAEAVDGTSANSTARLVARILRGHQRTLVYFCADYMLGVSNDTEKNKLFTEVYSWARRTDHVTNLNSFVNYNKILL